MTRIATANTYTHVQSDLMRAQQRQDTAQSQVSSGVYGSDLKAFAKQAETLLAARTVQTRNDAFIDQGKALSSRLDAQDLALNQAADAADGARTAVANAIANGRGDTLMSELGSWFTSATSALNTKEGGRYLFSGGQVDTAPVAASKLSDLTAAPVLSDVFKNDALKPVSRLDEATTIQSGFLADDIASPLFGAFKQVQAYVEANGDFSNPLTSAQQSFLEGMLTPLDNARDGLTQTAARNGLNQNRLDDSMTQQTSRQVMLKSVIAGSSEVDMSEAITRLEQARTAVQASAQVFNTLKGSSLLELLR